MTITIGSSTFDNVFYDADVDVRGRSSRTMPLRKYALGCIVAVWDVEVTDQFEQWWDALDEDGQEAIDAAVRVLEARGPALGRPLSTRSRAHATRT